MGKKLTGNIGAIAFGFATACLLGCVPSVRADAIYVANWTNLSSTAGSSNKVNATAVFDINSVADTLTVTLVNRTYASSAGDLLRDVSFNLSSSASYSGLGGSAVGNQLYLEEDTTGNPKTVTIKSDSLLTNTALDSHWSVSSTATNFTLSSSGSDDLIIGPQVGTNISSTQPPYYAGVSSFLENGGSIGNGGHGYVLDGVAAFTLSLTGLNSGTSINDVVLGFGTGSDVMNPVTPILYTNPPLPTGPSLPIPATLPLTAAGGLGLLAFALRKRKAIV